MPLLKVLEPDPQKNLVRGSGSVTSGMHGICIDYHLFDIIIINLASKPLGMYFWCRGCTQHYGGVLFSPQLIKYPLQKSVTEGLTVAGRQRDKNILSLSNKGLYCCSLPCLIKQYPKIAVALSITRETCCEVNFSLFWPFCSVVLCGKLFCLN